MLEGGWTTLSLRETRIYCVSLYLLLHLYSVVQQTLKSGSDLIQNLTWIRIWALHLRFWTGLIKRSKFPYTKFNPPFLCIFSHLQYDHLRSTSINTTALTQFSYVPQTTMLVRLLRNQWRVVIEGETFLSNKVSRVLRRQW